MSELQELDLRDAEAVADFLHQAAEGHRGHPMRRGASIHLPAEGHLLATGDLHDNALNFRRILKLADLDYESPASAKDPGPRYLVLHEVIHGPDRVNGLDLSIRMLTRCAELKVRYAERLLVLQSNHELAQLRSETITKEGVSVVEAFDEGIDFLYAGKAELVRAAANDYIRSLPLAIRCANGVMISHSLPSPRRIEAFDPAVLDRDLTDEDLDLHGSAYEMVWGRYQTEKVCRELAEAWGVNVFIVGHQPVEMGYEPVAHNTLIIASDHGHGVAVAVDLSQTYTRAQLIHRIRLLAGVSVPL